jgi:hypothetical protein
MPLTMPAMAPASSETPATVDDLAEAGRRLRIAYKFIVKIVHLCVPRRMQGNELLREIIVAAPWNLVAATDLAQRVLGRVRAAAGEAVLALVPRDGPIEATVVCLAFNPIVHCGAGSSASETARAPQ